MTPVQMLRVGLGDEAINVPLFRLPYVGQDSFGKPGGFFTTRDGEFGVVVDARISFDEAQKFIAEEIQNNVPYLAAKLQEAVPSAAPAAVA